MSWQIVEDDLTGAEIGALLAEHASGMLENSPAGSTHFLTLEKLRSPDVIFWSVHRDGKLAGCGALKRLDDESAELKSMRTAKEFLRQGVAARLLDHIMEAAEASGFRTLYLETGTSAAFAPAHKLYQKRGFTLCDAFGDYEASPHNIFMRYDLKPA
jgi:putative acetyltransferase